MRCLELSESVHHRDPRVHVQIFLSSGMLMSLPLQKTKDHTEVKAFSLSERQKSSLLQKVKVQPLKTRKKKGLPKELAIFHIPFHISQTKKRKIKNVFLLLQTSKYILTLMMTFERHAIAAETVVARTPFVWGRAHVVPTRGD